MRDSFYYLRLNQIATDTSNYAKIGTINANYKDVLYGKSFGDCTSSMDSTTCTNDTAQLKYIAYFPSTIDYSTCKQPAIIIIHGGGFRDCGGSYTDSGIVRICQEFAKRGIIAFSMEYRLGALIQNGKYSAQQLLATYRAAQDVRGCIRSIIKRQQATEPNPPPYRIDTTKLFIGGASAGSVTAMSAIFYTQSMLNQIYPGINNSNILGNVDKNFYYGESNITYKIRGFMDMWGGLGVPPGYLNNPLPPDSFFSYTNHPDTFPPTIIFHGVNDLTFNYLHQTVLFSKTAKYKSETHCLQTDPATYSLTTNNVADGYLLGRQDIYDMLIRKGISTELYLDCQMGHGLDNCTDTCYHSDFGTGDNNATATAVYMVQRAATFFPRRYQ